MACNRQGRKVREEEIMTHDEICLRAPRAIAVS